MTPNKFECAPLRASGCTPCNLLDSTQHGDKHQIGIIVGIDEDYRMSIPGLIVCEYLLRVAPVLHVAQTANDLMHM